MKAYTNAERIDMVSFYGRELGIACEVQRIFFLKQQFIL
jgi:hypothetical protein